MNERVVLGIEVGLLLALGLFLLNAACANMGNPTLLAGGFDFDGEIQSHTLEVDDGQDGSPEASDTGTTLGGSSDPGVVGQATSPGSGNGAVLEINSDTDTVLATCKHDHAGGAGDTLCSGEIAGAFPIDEVRGNAEFSFTLAATPADPAPGLALQADASLGIDCGGVVTNALVDLASPLQIVSVPVDPAAQACTVAFTISSVVNAATGGTGTVIVTAAVTARDVAPMECAHASECSGAQPLCGPNGRCQKGIEGEPCAVASLHCSTLFCGEYGCSDGDAGSFSRGAFECSPGYTFDVFECKGSACNGDGDCPPEAPICTDRGCSATGERGDGCLQGFGCRSGLCISNVCTEILGPGDDCSVPYTVCDAAYRCFADGTCQAPLPAGSSCNANQECQNPLTHSCLMGTCQPKSPLGGACEESFDCEQPWICNPTTMTCG